MTLFIANKNGNNMKPFSSLCRFLLSLGIVFSLAGCGATQIEVVGDFSVKGAKQIPIKAALVLNEELRNYSHFEYKNGQTGNSTILIPSGNIVFNPGKPGIEANIAMGEAHREVFSNVFGGVFYELDEFPDEQSIIASKRGYDLLIVPEIIKTEIYIPRFSSLPLFEARAEYKIRIKRIESGEEFNWFTVGYGASEPCSELLCREADSINAAAVQMLSDLASRILLELLENPTFIEIAT